MGRPTWVKACIVGFALGIPSTPTIAQMRELTFTDLMKFRQIRQPAVSEDGGWIAFHADPDRGDGAVIVRSTGGAVRYEVDRGSRPLISSDSRWVAMRLDPPFMESETAKDEDEKPKRGFALVDLSSGETESFAAVDSFGISADAQWVARLAFPTEASVDSVSDHDSEASKPEGRSGGLLSLTHLRTGQTIEIADVRQFAFDENGALIAYVISSADSTGDGIYVRDLTGRPSSETPLDVRPGAGYSSLTWTKEAAGRSWLAFVAGQADSVVGIANAAVLRWDGTGVQRLVDSTNTPKDWIVPGTNTLRWSKDRNRLFFGFRPAPPSDDIDGDTTGQEDPYDTAAILEKREVDVWHWNDPRINSQQKKAWKGEQKETFAAVYHLSTGEVTALGDSLVKAIGKPENAATILGRAESPYHKDLSWDGEFFDLYTIDLRTGRKRKVAERLEHTVSVSPGGRYVVFYRFPHWYVYDVASGQTRNVTQDLPAPFSNEDHDYPEDAPGYGIGGWVAEDGAVLVNDKYDVWQLSLSGSRPALNLTGSLGREEGRTFRVIDTDPEKLFYEEGDRLLLSSFDNGDKRSGFYSAKVGTAGVSRLVEEARRFTFVGKAKDADVLVFRREDYDEFPDLWVSDLDFDDPRRVTELNPQIEEFAWGESELVEWTSADGVPLQGVLIRPGNYEPGRRYPVIVYFYRFMSDRLHTFNEPVVNHRPSFPLYASNGYAVFLPDIRFEIGRPGFSAMKALVPGVQKLVDMGVADPDAIGLHGHSWSGYQTAFIVTQTDIFAAAVAGAPVSNMTSAYGGIRWESGRGRQFQYEKAQSRLGGSLWEARDRYIDNSPIFFADRVNTPLLMMFGDEDGAVPWYQGIELYLALRRNGKDAIFLQYRGEPHHLKKYPNKLDYSIKMKEYFDHYLKGAPAPAWISTGVPYAGD